MTSQVANCDARPFLGDLSILDLTTEYRSLKEDPVREFYRPCLLNAINYKRAVGYFRSTVYNVIGSSIVRVFARRGGRTERDLFPRTIRGRHRQHCPRICS